MNKMNYLKLILVLYRIC